MTTYTHKTAALALSAVTAAALTAAFAPHAEAAQVRSGQAGTPALVWRSCAQSGGPAGQECAALSVPLDYAAPSGRKVSLAVSRIRSEDPGRRRGTLVVLPGGPGGSGVQRLTQKGAALGRELAGGYDLVAFDPRGVGASTTASCALDPQDRRLVTLRNWPLTPQEGGFAANVARAERQAAACAANGGELLRSFTTANQARDLDRLREALGERKLSAWGTSYGTYVAAVYAQKFPQRTDRVVLDSTGDPDPARVERGWLANMSPAADERFPDFAAWAADPARAAEGLRVGEHPDDVRPLFLALAERLDRAPRPSTTEGVPLTGNLLRQAMQNALYADAAFPGLARLIGQAQDPAATPVLPPELAQPLRDEDAALALAVVCNDVKWPTDVASYERSSAADRAAHPLTAGMPASIPACAFWKDAPTEEPTRITGAGPSNILMVQNLRDPATPYFGALRMRAALGDRARLVSVDHGGHGVYLGNGNACGDRAVTEFLTTGHRPARDAYCGAPE
ncbi:alpha/beta hydrolase [Streptomyces sp. G-G2]|uniref:alpha/beta hydrolase n=1 Tax=Streptomyces sp. G-G2 TaxID=3046201 RepID=UPI0024B9A3C8|nr:alpha/beta hydrolase [Streptomyces sp. G-G2]MDJ0382471.1 alpha/beta hydrolase [Streptomyces sp. G-G2]